MRQEKGETRWLAESTDGGNSWTNLRTGVVVTPVACAIERFSPGSGASPYLLWTGPKGPKRKELLLRTSLDGGKTFSKGSTISSDLAAYSEIAILKDNSVGILWERGTAESYQFITFTRVNQDWIKSAP